MRTLFDYHRPSTIDEAVQMKSHLGSSSVYWAGGTDLQLLWAKGALEIEHAIDLTHLPFRGMEENSGKLTIGALATLADLERAAHLGYEGSALSKIAEVMCTPQTRTLATIGGNVCHASPSGDLAPTLLTMDTTVKLSGSAGSRDLPLDEFYVFVNQTAKSEDELVTGFSIPVVERRRSSHSRIARTAVDIALALAAASLTLDEDGRIFESRIALGSVAPTAIRAYEAEAELVGHLVGELTDALLDSVASLAASASVPITDVRASAAFRQKTVGVLVRRAVQQAAAEFTESAIFV